MSELLYDLTQIRTILSNTAAFRTWCGAATPAIALTHISIMSDESPTLPLCVLAHGAGWRREVTTFAGYSTQPEINILFMEACNKTTSTESAFTTILTSVSAIMAGLEAQSTTGYVITEWAMADNDNPSRAKHQNGQDYVSVEVAINGGQR
jgi:hypothetical protein